MLTSIRSSGFTSKAAAPSNVSCKACDKDQHNYSHPVQSEHLKPTVTYDATTRCYEYKAPGYHRKVCKSSPVKDAVAAATIIGVPSLVGAAASAVGGVAAGAVFTGLISPFIGMAAGAAIGAKTAWKASHKNPLYTAIAAAVGAGVGAIAYPILQLPGTVAGLKGALIATGSSGALAGLWSIHRNHKIDQEAQGHGYEPPAT